jgi:hypothetical protein
MNALTELASLSTLLLGQFGNYYYSTFNKCWLHVPKPSRQMFAERTFNSGTLAAMAVELNAAES